MPPKALLLILALVIIGAVVFIQFAGAPKAPSSSEAPAGPPADAAYLDVGPSGVLAAGAVKGPDADAALNDVLGKWNDGAGWQGVVEAITTYRGREALRLTEYDAKVIGGSYTIIAVVGEGHGKEKGNIVHVQGRVGEVEVRATSVGVFNQIVLEQARIVK